MGAGLSSWGLLPVGGAPEAHVHGSCTWGWGVRAGDAGERVYQGED